jgi:hypothetical protein
MSGIYSGGAPYAGSFAYASLPSASTYSGYEAFVTDWGANGTKVRSNGTRWLPMGGRVLLKHLGAAQAGVANSATIVLQTPAMPAGTVQANDLIVVDIPGITKTGTTDSLNIAIYAGTAGTTSDANLTPSVVTALSSGSVNGSSLYTFKVVSNTSVQRAGTMNGVGNYANQSSNAIPAAVTVTDMSASALIWSYAIQSSGTTNTVGIQDGAIWQIVN